ncbi:MAG: DUF29 domain-containing protein [Acidobacteriota bacterium]|nr:DUF29 domain-containing protein [Acidobacteriota bacterium]
MTAAVEPLYDIDFCMWAESIAERLRAGDLDGLDLENIAEEIESLGKSEYRGITTSLKVLIVHILKWDYQKRKRSESWVSTIGNRRIEIEGYLEMSPSLERKVRAAVPKAYGRAAREAAAETNLPRKAFPGECPYTWQEILEREFRIEEEEDPA